MTVSVSLSPVPVLQFFDNAGNINVGGTLLTQSGGVNYATYSEPTGTTALPNPIPLNSRGEVSTAAGSSSQLYLQTGVAYTFTLYDRNGNQLWSIGNIYAPGNSFPTASGSANAQVITNAVPISFGNGVTQWFLPVAANTASMTINVDNTGAKTVKYLGQNLTGNELQLNCPMLMISDGTNWNIVWTAKGPATDYYADTGGANALVISAGYAFGYTNGMRFKVKAANTTTLSTATFQANQIATGKSSLPIYYADGTTPLAAGAIIQNNIYTFTYNSSLNSGNGGWVCSDPSRVTGSFTITLTGFGSNPTGTINYSIGQDGKTVFVWAASAITGTSNATTMTGTGIPSAIQPVTAKYQPIRLSDNGGGTGGSVQIAAASGTWTFGVNFGNAGGAFTGGGSKGINSLGTGFSYTLD